MRIITELKKHVEFSNKFTKFYSSQKNYPLVYFFSFICAKLYLQSYSLSNQNKEYTEHIFN